MGTATRMTKIDAARIQSAEAARSGGKVKKGSFAARAQSAADKGAQSQGAGLPSKTGNKSGRGRDNKPPRN